MTKTVLSIEGMACGMCEAHVNDAIRANFSVKKVSSSHKKGQTEVISEQPLDEALLRSTITATGFSRNVSKNILRNRTQDLFVTELVTVDI